MIEVVWRGIKLLDDASAFDSLWDGDILKGESEICMMEDIESRDETTTTSSCSSTWSDDRSTRSPLHLQEPSVSPVPSETSCLLLRNSFSQRLSRSSTIPLYDNEVKESILDRSSSFYLRYGKPTHDDDNSLYQEGANTAKRKVRKGNPMKRRLSDAPQLEHFCSDNELPAVNTLFIGSRLRISYSSRTLKVATTSGIIILCLIGLFFVLSNTRSLWSLGADDDLSAMVDGAVQMSDDESSNSRSFQQPNTGDDGLSAAHISSKMSENKKLIESSSDKSLVDWEDDEFTGPSIAEAFSAVWEPLERRRDVPLFLQVPQSGGDIVNNILRQCHNFVTTSEVDTMAQEQLQIVAHPDGGQRVNMNTFTDAGLQLSRELGLVRSGLVDVIFTNRFQESAPLFDRNHRGRVFTMIRNPVHQSASTFFHLRNASSSDPKYNRAIRVMTLEDYAASPDAGFNPLTRLLTGDDKGQISDRHIALAKEVLKQKILVGIEERFDESIIRFQNYFGWKNKGLKSCTDQQKKEASKKTNTSPNLDGESAIYRLLAKRNWADMELYRYAVRLFEEQDILIKQVHR